MRISDWSSDVCSSDLPQSHEGEHEAGSPRYVKRLAIITGMAAEADCLAEAIRGMPADDQPLLYCAGGSAARARDGALRLARQGVHGLVSFGIAGGLDPSLSPGDLILAQSVMPLGGASIATEERRSEERRVGKECVSQWRSRGSQDH